MAVGIQAVKFVNENYQSLKESNGAYAGAALGVAGAAVVFIGIVVIVRGSSKMLAAQLPAPASQYSASFAPTERKPSKIAQILFSLLGFVFGSIACLYIFISAAALWIETEKASAVSIGSLLIAVVLCFVSLLFGLASLFLRGYGLGRVPFYFLIGSVLTFVAVRVFKVNMLEWQQLMDFLQ